MGPRAEPNPNGGPLSLFHAVIAIDHQTARILPFDDTQVRHQTIRAHSHHTRQHGSTVRTDHEFFAEVCDALDGIAEVLVTGPCTGLSDFQHYLHKHRPEVRRRVVGFEATDHPSDAQLVALAREFFLRHDRMAGTPMPT